MSKQIIKDYDFLINSISNIRWKISNGQHMKTFDERLKVLQEDVMTEKEKLL